MKKFALAILFVMLYAGMPGMSNAQTPKPPKKHRTLKNGNTRLTAGQPGGYQFSVVGAYSNSTNNVINNGVQSTFEYAVGGRWSLRVDSFGLNNPAGTLINTAGAQWKLPLNAVFGPKSPVAFQNIYLGVHGGLGAVKNSSGGNAFAASAGMSMDYQVTSNMFIRFLEISDAYSRGMVPANQVLGNYNNIQFGTGVGFSF